MVENSKIEWCDHTFNPWVGCTKVSSACDHCYAEGWARRTGQSQLWQGERRRTSAVNWQQPLKWNKQAEHEGRRFRVFCASLADVFDNQVPELWRAELWRLIAATPNLDWLLLTKRPQNIARRLPDPRTGTPAWGTGWPNVWLGSTAENQAEADRRIPHLLAVPAAVHFLSCEPLLGPIDFEGAWHGDSALDAECWGDCAWCNKGHPPLHNCQRGLGDWERGRSGLDWIIAGGESGPGARPSHPEWFRSLRDQCAAAGVPFFFKQHGDWREFDPAPEIEEVTAGSEYADAILALAHNPAWITRDGQVFHRQDDLPDEVPCRLMERLGKARAGRLLDGREHSEFPR